MLIGKYNHTIDIKNRVSLPSKWRTYLGDKIIITTGLDKALYIYSQEEWDKIAAALNSNSFLSQHSRNISRYIFANAYDLSIDSHGRVLLPESLLEYADLKVDAVLAGSYNRAEIWNETNYNQSIKDITENINEITASVLKEINNK